MQDISRTTLDSPEAAAPRWPASALPSTHGVELPGSEPERTLVSMLFARSLNGHEVAATIKQGGEWIDVTWRDVCELVGKVANGLLALGVAPGDRVAIFAPTSLRWAVCDLAVAAVGAVTVPIYPSSTADEIRHILAHSGARHLFVGGKPEGADSALERARAALATNAAGTRILGLAEIPEAESEIGWSGLLLAAATFAASNRAELMRRARKVRASDPSCFIYTSGTSGSPKGVIITHGNWTCEADGIAQLGHMLPQDAVLLFLPLAHAFAQTAKAAWLSLGFRMIFVDSPDELAQSLRETRPTVVPAVPRVFEKIYQGIVATGFQRRALGGLLFRAALRAFDRYVVRRDAGHSGRTLWFELLARLVFSRIRRMVDARVGGRIRIFFCGGAPLPRKVAHFFDLLGLPVLEGYGLTETCAAVTVNRPDAYRVGTVGQVLAGVELKLAEDGEIMVRGGNVTRGYHDDALATAEAIDADGWFLTGDIGKLDADGYLQIIDRKKDLIVTSGGKNVAPQRLENRLVTFPVINQALVHGDRRKYLSVLITVDEQVAQRLVSEECELTGAALVQRPEVLAEVQRAIDELNATEPAHCKLQRFALLAEELSQARGELTPTLKIKRKLCTTRYRAVLDSLYDEPWMD